MEIYSNTAAIHIAKKFPGYTPTCLQIFNNLEIKISVSHSSKKCIVIASVCNHHDLVELLLILDSLRNTREINIIFAYLMYGKQDSIEDNSSIASRLVQRFLEFSNVSKIFHLDLHSTFFTVENVELSAFNLFEKDIKQRYDANELVIVSPDFGVKNKALALSNNLGAEHVQCMKQRSFAGKITSFEVLGNCKDKTCVVLDDILDSGSTMWYASEALMKAGANKIIAYCTHGVFSPGADDLIKKSCISEVVLTDSIYKANCDMSKVRRISIVPVLSRAIDGML